MDLQERLEQLNNLRSEILKLKEEISDTMHLQMSGQQSLGIRINNSFIKFEVGEEERLKLCIEGIFNDRIIDLQSDLEELESQAYELLVA